MCAGTLVLVVFVDGDAAAIVGFKAGGGEVELVDSALAADGVKECVAGDFFLALQVGHHGAVGQLLDALHLFAEAHGDAGIAEVIAEGFDDFAIGELEQAVALFDERDADAEDGKHAGVLDADDASADHQERAGQFRQGKNLVAVDDGAAIDGDPGRVGGPGADGKDHAVGFEGEFALRTLDAQLMRVDEAGDAMNDIDAVAGKLRLSDVHFGLDHRLDAECQVGHGDLFLDLVVHAVEGLEVVAGQVHHGFAHGF